MRILDYSAVLQRMTAEGFDPLYYNAGAFGFAKDKAVEIVGWVGPDDPSIREQMRTRVHTVREPYAINLARMIRRAWEHLLPGVVWVMPKSHWAYELDFGNKEWLPEALAVLQTDASALAKLTNAAAIEFDGPDANAFEQFLQTLFERLRGSDFVAAFPGRATLCTLHHHQQAWWETSRADVAKALQSTQSLSL